VEEATASVVETIPETATVAMEDRRDLKNPPDCVVVVVVVVAAEAETFLSMAL